MNLKLLGINLINFDNVLHVRFDKESSGTSLKAIFRFVDGSERTFEQADALTLLKWMDEMFDSEVDPIGSRDDLAALIEAFAPVTDEDER
jgi:hypothetical protein